MNSACDACQSRPGPIPIGVEFHTTALPEFSSQETSIDLESDLTLLLSRIDRMESNIANVTKTINLHERITALEQEKVPLHPDSYEYQEIICVR